MTEAQTQINTTGFANQLFAFFDAKKTNEVHIYLPAYLRINCKAIKQIELEELESMISLTIILDICCKGFCPEIKNFIRTKFAMCFRRNDVLKLNADKNHNIKDDLNQNYIKFTIRKILKTRVQPYVKYSPLQLLDQIISININPEVYQFLGQHNQKKIIYFHLNFMSIDQKNEKDYNLIISKPKHMDHAEYKLAGKRIFFQFTNNRLSRSLQNLGRNFYKSQMYLQFDKNFQKKNAIQSHLQQNQIEKPLSFSYAHYHLPIYKNPVVSALIIFLPLVILAILNLSIFFTERQMSNRITNIATLLIAFIQLIPIIRDEIPPTPHPTLTQIVIMLESTTAMFCLAQTIRIKNSSLYSLQDDQFVASYNPWKNPFFIISCIITFIVILYPFILLGYFFFYLERTHTQKQRVLTKKNEQKQNKLQNQQDSLKKKTGKKTFFSYYNYNTQANDYFFKLKKKYQQNLLCQFYGQQSQKRISNCKNFMQKVEAIQKFEKQAKNRSRNQPRNDRLSKIQEIQNLQAQFQKIKQKQKILWKKNNNQFFLELNKKLNLNSGKKIGGK